MFKDIENLLTRIRSQLTFVIAIAYLSNVLFQSVLIHQLILILTALAIILSLIAVTDSSKVIGYFLFALSIMLLLYFHAPLSIWAQAVEANLYLVVMFTLVPLLRIPIQHGGYFEALQGFFRRYVNNNRRFYLLVSFIAAFLGILVNLAVVPLVHEIAKASDLSANKKLLCSAISRGFFTCTIWAPTAASIALIIQLTGAKWHLFFPFAIFSGMIAGLIGYIMTVVEEKRSEKALRAYAVTLAEEIGTGEVLPGATQEQSGEINYHKVIELCIFGSALITGIGLVSFFTGMSTLIVVSIASVIFPVIWLTFIGRLPVFFREFKGEYFHTCLPGLKNEITLFVGAGLFAASITYSHLGNYVPSILSLLVGNNILLFSIVVVSLSHILAVLGVHPIVTVTIIGETVKAAQYGVTPTYMAMILAVSWSMGVIMSPSSANIIAVAGLAGQSPMRVGPYWNGKYALISSVVLLIMLTIFRWLGIL
ncbi:C4-dicarboxylate ABC transporter [Candidatus Formimonas warabiya]|uniref:C4-dicarboxylate ABC transporter n=1 Tax=Formimonas warabiya TaxID=1761012 RepID=UPI001F400F57|nr:C4-dicarboxylate ABC transporter [Candidatus Formimonas warabiya]